MDEDGSYDGNCRRCEKNRYFEYRAYSHSGWGCGRVFLRFMRMIRWRMRQTLFRDCGIAVRKNSLTITSSGGTILKDSIALQIILQIILIALNAVFACAEIAVISMNDNKLAKMAENGDKRAVRLARLTSQPARFLATIQVAITLSGFLGSAFAADNFADRLVKWLLSLGVPVPESTLNTVSVILITLILSYFTLVFGELVPKRIAMKKAEALALGMSAMISFISKLFAPIGVDRLYERDSAAVWD